ncbi:MAG: laccase domain-containing protein [Coriobacteriales bacterium]|nr:laccase domain-containing protein [Coriobacteriales bacterium]
MDSIPFLDERYPVRTICADDTDLQRYDCLHTRSAIRAALDDYLHMPLKRVVPALQARTGNVLAINGENDQEVKVFAEATHEAPADKYDAVVTSVPGILVYVWAADCLPLFLYEPTTHVAAIAHCGWQCICNAIVPNTLAVMSTRFGVNPAHVVAAFGPAICQRCCEVDERLVESFSERFSADELSNIFRPGQHGKRFLSLSKAVTYDLVHAGIGPDQCFDTGICTYESPIHSSYRRDGLVGLDRQLIFGIVLK